jgi:hypothetical protein
MQDLGTVPTPSPTLQVAKHTKIVAACFGARRDYTIAEKVQVSFLGDDVQLGHLCVRYAQVWEQGKRVSQFPLLPSACALAHDPDLCMHAGHTDRPESRPRLICKLEENGKQHMRLSPRCGSLPAHPPTH